MGKLIIALYVAMTLLFLGLAMYMDARHQPSTYQSSYMNGNVKA